jgi:dTMP kinase
MTETDDTRGFLISFEGSEGSGKSTQISRIANRFEDAGYDVVVTREPGGTPIGEEIRHILMHADEADDMTPETELLLFAASRAQLVRQVILPAIKEGKIVLCDRFMDSTTVYQGVARQIQSEPVHLINTFAVGDLSPDVTVVIDLDAEVGLQRVRHRANDMPDRMEKENIEFYQKVRTGYLMLAKAVPERFIVVDGELPRAELEDIIWKQLRQRVI